jgi:hypothetical protein
MSQGPLADAVPSPPKGRVRRRQRARTISIKRLSKRELERGRALYPEIDYWKPQKRSDCADGPRPCPYVSCKHHLYVDVHPVRGSIKLNFPDLEVQEMVETCSLDVAERGGLTFEDVAELMNITWHRVQQIQQHALDQVGDELHAYAPDAEKR